MARQPWATLLALRTFFADYDKGFPHDVVMETPYGRVRYGSRTRGASLRLEQALVEGLQLQATAGYAHDQRYLKDTSTGIFDWYGRRAGTRTVGDTVTAGEIKAGGYDQNLVQHSAYARVQLSWRFIEGQARRLALSPTYSTRNGDGRQIPEGSRDALEARQNVWMIVTGLEHRLDAFDGLLDNSLFVKDYIYRAHGEEPRYGGVNEQHDVDFHRAGVGDALRLRVSEDLYLKASYEWTTRLPRADEVFGDGMRVSANLDLLPETSHNANLRATFLRPSERWGSYRADATLFLRDADRLITRLPDLDREQTFFKYQNILHARSVGLEAAAGWTSPGEFVLLDVNVTWQDFRNISEEGTAARYKGDANPNRPWLFGNGAVRLRKRTLFTAEDTLTFSWYGRYVHAFFRSWESAGALASKAEVDAQFLHALLLTYVVRAQRWTFSSTSEVQNITDAKAFDFYGLQLPGRAAYYNARLEL